MIDFPVLTVILTTFNRDRLLRESIQRMRQNLFYSGGVQYLVGADGNLPLPGVLDDLPCVTVIPGPNRGFGANLNSLLRSVQTDIVFQTCEDINLMQPLYLDAHVQKLLEDPTAGWIRLMWIGAHNYIARLDGSYWRISWDSPELYIPSCRSHLKHRRFHDYYGMYPEEPGSGTVEESFCHQCINRHRETHAGPDVLVPLFSVLPDEAWVHTGVGLDDLP